MREREEKKSKYFAPKEMAMAATKASKIIWMQRFWKRVLAGFFLFGLKSSGSELKLLAVDLTEPPLLNLDNLTATDSLAFSRSSTLTPRSPAFIASSLTAPRFSAKLSFCLSRKCIHVWPWFSEKNILTLAWIFLMVSYKYINPNKNPNSFF